MKTIKRLIREVLFYLSFTLFGLVSLVALLVKALCQEEEDRRPRVYRFPLYRLLRLDKERVLSIGLGVAVVLIVGLLLRDCYFASQPIKGWDKIEEKSHRLVPMNDDTYLFIEMNCSNSDYIYYHIEGGQVEKVKRTNDVYVFEEDNLATESARIDWYQGADKQWMKPKVEIFVPKGSATKTDRGIEQED